MAKDISLESKQANSLNTIGTYDQDQQVIAKEKQYKASKKRKSVS